MSSELERASGADGWVPASVASRWIATHGTLAHEWLNALPDTVRCWTHRWELTLEGTLAGGSVSVVLAVRTDGNPAVLKLGAPWSEWSPAEAAALRLWNGNSAPRLVKASDDGRALLMERVVPGTRPARLGIAGLGGLLMRLSRPQLPVPREIPPLAEAVATRFRRAEENRSELMDLERLARARTAACALAAEPVRSAALVHGDFLTKNILHSAEQGLVAIDPNPAFGDPCYDAAQWAVTERPISQAPERSAAVAAYLGLDPDRQWAWVVALGAVEVCLASEERARETLDLLEGANPVWW